MKVRKGFVTNSSSSSFILGFKDQEEIDDLLNKVAIDHHYVQLYEDIINVPKHSLNTILDRYKKEINYSESWSLREKLKLERNLTYEEVFRMKDTKEFHDLLESAIQEKVNILAESLKNKTIIVELEYGDGGYGQDGVLEHYIVPNLKCCFARISHH